MPLTWFAQAGGEHRAASPCPQGEVSLPWIYLVLAVSISLLRDQQINLSIFGDSVLSAVRMTRSENQETITAFSSFH